jgi:hypothetical protein
MREKDDQRVLIDGLDSCSAEFCLAQGLIKKESHMQRVFIRAEQGLNRAAYTLDALLCERELFSRFLRDDNGVAKKLI